MTDDNHGHDEHDHAPGAGEHGDHEHHDFDDFEGGARGSLGESLRNNPAVKVAIIVGGLIVVLGALILFSGKTQHAPLSKVAGGTDVKQAPGSAPVSDEMAKALQESNTQGVEQAEKTGGSAIGVPITAAKEPETLPDDSANNEDPLARWRRIQDERSKRDTLKKPEVVQDNSAEAVKSLASAMAKQMESILKNIRPTAPQEKMIMTSAEWNSQQAAKQKALDDQKAKVAAAATGDQTKTLHIIVPAGTIEYAQLITQANTDAPGPVLAEIVSGPLTGSKILGSFQALDNYLVLSFNTVVIKGISYSVTAVALDPDTANPGLVSEIDHRYLERVILPAAAAFVEGLGSAVADSGNTNVSVDDSTVVSSTTRLNTRQQVYKGVEEGASKIGDMLDQEASQTKPLIIVNSGTAMGIMFTSPVTDQSSLTK